jgi:hypothetical protein
MATRGLPRWPHLDTEAAALPAAESLLLDAMRAWAAAPAPLPAAALVLAAAGAEALALPLDTALRAARPALAAPLCPRLTEAEAVLLTATALAQRQEREAALAVLGRLAPPPGACRALGALLSLGSGMRRLGLLLEHPFRR